MNELWQEKKKRQIAKVMEEARLNLKKIPYPASIAVVYATGASCAAIVHASQYYDAAAKVVRAEDIKSFDVDCSTLAATLGLDESNISASGNVIEIQPNQA